MSSDHPEPLGLPEEPGKSRAEKKAERRRLAQAGKKLFKGKFAARDLYHGKAQVLAELRRRMRSGLPAAKKGDKGPGRR